MTVTRSVLQRYVYFPEEILFSIFSWLPLQSLFRCKFVCKDWYRYLNGMIRDPSFVKLHHSRLNQNNPDFLVLNFRNYCRSQSLCQYFMLNCQALENLDTSLQAKKFDYCYGLATEEQRIIVGSSNGLMCFTDLSNKCEKFSVINPITRETLMLPKVSNHSINLSPSFCGFAYDETAKTYKVVRTWFYSPWSKGVEVCTLGSDIWRKKETVRNIPHCPLLTSSQVLLNGSLHWIPACLDVVYNKRFARAVFDSCSKIPTTDKPIVVFNVGSEKLTTLDMPPDSGRDTLDRSFSSLGNSLCLADNNISGEIVVWIMKDYGVKESWRKEYVIKKELLGSKSNYSAVKLLEIGKNGKVLLYFNDDHGYFDLEKGKFSRVLVHGSIPKGSNKFGATFHVGSLISPKSIGV